MKCLVTGGAGFVGSHLVDRLVRLKYDVTVWDAFTTGRKENLNPKAPCYNIWVEDISPENHADKKYDVIFHLAGEARIQPSFKKPMTSHDSNVTGTIKMLELAKLCKARLVYASSSSVYHDMYANPYTFTKQIAENYCTLYNKVYGVPVAIARFFNVYGPRQMEEGDYATVIGIFEKQKREGKPLTITGNGEQRRDFTHVDDIVTFLIFMADPMDKWKAKVFNIGTGKNYSINEVAKMFKHPIEYIPKRPGEAQETLADITELRNWFGFRPACSLKEYIDNLGA
jgi:UDP-glucose 4-epimerase